MEKGRTDVQPFSRVAEGLEVQKPALSSGNPH